MAVSEVKKEYSALYSYLDYTLHELPAGVLYDTNGANEDNCLELMRCTYRLEQLSKELSEEDASFIEYCRWHYERDPHYLSRQKHFGSYGNYIVKYNGPSRVKA
ncbi:hypothetical protein JK628_14140 [Shewanella sp. KX20019]|uniref:hypothetical protein n=1 Tax=Shewanella sp. KX20019 TaxID=2803864 RepID=UPI0019281E62|nr:hypothetical protein [Shewanella sp. KX20019]QQX78708.1 hypothetical protein JK628_14140 [Shewanella sp. KX20019]